MKPDEVKHLLGGYATGTLTSEEQKALFNAALQDQDLFDALAREHALKDALDEPAARHELIAALEDARSWWARAGAWFRWPYALAGAGACVAAALMIVTAIRYNSAGAPPTLEARTVRRADRIDRPLEMPKAAARKPKRSAVVLPAPGEAEPALQAPAPLALRSMATQARHLFYGTAAQAISGRVVGGVVSGYRASPAAESSLAGPVPLGLRYSLQDTHLIVESNTDAVLYAFRRSGNGWVPLTAGALSLEAHTPATAFSIDAAVSPGTVQTILVLSRAPVLGMARSGAELTAEVEKLRSANEPWTLLTETVEGSTFVVAPAQSPAAILAAPVALP